MPAAHALIDAVDGDAFTSAFPRLPFAIRHRLVDDPLFSLSRIVELVRELPRDHIEFNSGKVAIGQDPNTVPVIDLDPQEIVRRIESCGAWMVLKRVEAHPDYRGLLERTLLSVAQAQGYRSIKDAGFEDIRGFLFVSSPNSTTPFHIDGEDNFFVHIHGDKYFTICDNRDGSVLSDEAIEAGLCSHRNVSYQPDFESKSTCYSLQPGEGVFVPYLWPHWVRTGSEYSISLAVTWKTKSTIQKNEVFLVNSMLRRLGLPQPAPGRTPALDAVKVAAFRAVKLIADPLRKSEGIRTFLRKVALGRHANYFMRTGAKPST